MNRYNIKKIILIILIVIIVGAVFLSIRPKRIIAPVAINDNNISIPVEKPSILYLDEKLFAENYVKENIAIIATNKPVLGGTWYVVNVIIDPAAKSGEVVYEDGHILSKAKIEYIYQNNPESLVITKFEVIN